MNLCELNISQMRDLLRSKQVSAPELLQAHLDRISEVDPKIRAFLTVDAERAVEAAKKAQTRIDQGEDSALVGIPYALKDNICTKGLRTTCGSKILQGWVPPYNATIVERLNAAGAILVGKCNLDEFAMGSSTEFSGFHPTHNPWDLTRVPGGSSGGSAAAVASGMVPLAFGSDTGGSVRQPSSLTGIVGMKPTYGRVSRYGLIAFSSSLDQIGPFSRTVEDAATAMRFVSGHDPLDSTSANMSAIGEPAQSAGPRLAVPSELMAESVQPGVRALMESALEKLRQSGAVVEEVSLPMIEYGVSTYYIIAPAEASSNLARFDGVRYGLRVKGETPAEMMEATRTAGFGREVQERILIGTYVLSSGYYDAFYTKAHKARTLMRRQFQEVFEKFDAVVMPTSPTVAFKIGEHASDPMALKVADYCTIPANLGGFPAISVNCGFDQGLPVGFQIMCDSFAEERMFGIAKLCDSLFDANRMPAIAK